MKRRAVRIFVLLLLLGGGAIVNISVAWAVTLWPEPPEPSSWTCGFYIPDGMATMEKSASVSLLSQEFKGDWIITHDISGVSTTTAGTTMLEASYESGFGDLEHDVGVTTYSAGWPLRSLTMRFVWESTGQQRKYESHGSFILPRSLSLKPNALPWQPIWSGFSINTVFYAGVLWMVFALGGMPFALRRRSRRRRGLCVKCAYPVGTSGVCTECGTAHAVTSAPKAVASSS